MPRGGCLQLIYIGPSCTSKGTSLQLDLYRQLCLFLRGDVCDVTAGSLWYLDVCCVLCVTDYTAATFLHETVGVGVAVRVDAREAARRALRHALDVSMFVRTRKPTGHIFYIGNPPR